MLDETQSSEALHWTLLKRMYTFSNDSFVDILSPQEKQRIISYNSVAVYTLMKNNSYPWDISYSSLATVQNSPQTTAAGFHGLFETSDSISESSQRLKSFSNSTNNSSEGSNLSTNSAADSEFPIDGSSLCMCQNALYCDCTPISTLFGLNKAMFGDVSFFLYGKTANSLASDEFVIGSYSTLYNFNLKVSTQEFQKETTYFNFTLVFQYEIDPIFVDAGANFTKSISRFLERMVAIIGFFLFMLIVDW